MNSKLLNNEIILPIFLRFVKERKIFVRTINILNNRTNGSDLKVLLHIRGDKYDEFFQSTRTFTQWEDTAEGREYWYKISMLWRVYLFCSDIPVDKDSLIISINQSIHHYKCSKIKLLDKFPELNKIAHLIH